MSKIDAHRILPRLWQGSKPPVGHALRDAGFDVVVLCAFEYQPRSHRIPGVSVVHAPLDDHLQPLTTDEWKTILGAASFSADRLRSGDRVLVTCHQGINRSGIVTALIVCLLTGMTGKQAVQHVRQRRPGALRNTSFAQHVERVMV